LWEASGVKYKDLIDKLISLAFTRERARKNTMFTLDTNILSEKSFGFKGSKGGKA
jgi:D-alanine-D-alanine ligase